MTPSQHPDRDTIENVPNQPKTPMRSYRIDDELYGELVKLAKARGISVSEAVRQAIEKYINDAVWDDGKDAGN